MTIILNLQEDFHYTYLVFSMYRPQIINNISIRNTGFFNHQQNKISLSDKVTQWTTEFFFKVEKSIWKNRGGKFFYKKVLPEALLHLNQKAASYSLEFQLHMVR